MKACFASDLAVRDNYKSTLYRHRWLGVMLTTRHHKQIGN